MLTINGNQVVLKDKNKQTPEGKKIISELITGVDWEKKYIPFKLARKPVMTVNDRGQVVPEKFGIVSIPPVFEYKRDSDVIEVCYYKSLSALRKFEQKEKENGEGTSNRACCVFCWACGPLQPARFV